MTMTREDLIALVSYVYSPIVGEDAHWMHLIQGRPVAHLREAGYTVTRISATEYKVKAPL